MRLTMYPDLLHVHWHKARDTNPVAISVLCRRYHPDAGEYTYAVLDMVGGAVLPIDVEWLPLALFGHPLYVTHNQDTEQLLP